MMILVIYLSLSLLQSVQIVVYKNSFKILPLQQLIALSGKLEDTYRVTSCHVFEKYFPWSTQKFNLHF